MIAICKETTYCKKEFGGILLFIENKQYSYDEFNGKHRQIVDETGYKWSFRFNTFYNIFYTNKELRKIKLEKLKYNI